MVEQPSELALSVVVVVHDMARELPRTLRSLDPEHQRGIDAGAYEVIVVDNGSASPVDDDAVARFTGAISVHRLDPAPPSPARAANLGIERAQADLVGVIMDGARLASPGLLSGARRAGALAPRPVITAPAFHLGPVSHMRAHEVGYDQAAEDALLAGIDWEHDASKLFEISTVAGSSGRGLFGPMGESSSLFMPRALWEELGGYDEAFVMPGGGLVNHDLYRRACDLAGTALFVLLGEATFHQFHGGAATSRRFGWDEMHAEYETIRFRPYAPPPLDPCYVGGVPTPFLPYLERSAKQAITRRANRAE